MKPAPFEYVRAGTVEEVCALLAADEDAMVLAGGQTLIPMLNMRLARPSVVIDAVHIPDLHGIVYGGGGRGIEIGAMVSQAHVEAQPRLAKRLPLLAKALAFVGHAPTRARGTIGGSVANADAAAEIPLVLVTLGGVVGAASAEGKREIAAADFFLGPMQTALAEGEIVTHVRFPPHPLGTGFREIATRQSDYAIVSAAATVEMADGVCTSARAGLGGATGRPMRVDVGGLVRSDLGDAALTEAAGRAVEAVGMDPPPHTTEAYCRRAAARLLTQALADARDEALA